MNFEPRTKKALIGLASMTFLLLLVFMREDIAALFHENGSTSSFKATGTVEITTVEVSAEVGGTISLLAFDEGERVEEGDLMARIDRPDLRAQMDRDSAGAVRAKAMLEDLKKGARNEEIAQARAARDTALARQAQAQRDADRYASLYAEQVLSKKEFEQAQLAADLAANDLTRAREALQVMEAGPRLDQVTAQEEALKQARAVMSMTRSALDKTEIRSPVGGTILTRNFEPGELAPQGRAIYTIGIYTDCNVRIYVPSNMLGLISPGQKAEVRVDSFPDTVFRGTVAEIAQEAEFAPRQSITPDERANLVFRVKIAVDNPEGLLKPGMPADVILQ